MTSHPTSGRIKWKLAGVISATSAMLVAPATLIALAVTDNPDVLLYGLAAFVLLISPIPLFMSLDLSQE